MLAHKALKRLAPVRPRTRPGLYYRWVGSPASVKLTRPNQSAEPKRQIALTGVVTLSEIGPIWTISQQAKSLKSIASILAVVGKFRSV